MWVTILAIFGIIGLFLLGILGLVLAVILLALLVPLRYQAEGSFHSSLRGSAVVSWLLHILCFRVAYDGDLKAVFCVLGIPLFRFPEAGTDSENRESMEKAEDEETAEDRQTEFAPIDDQMQELPKGCQKDKKHSFGFSDRVKRKKKRENGRSFKGIGKKISVTIRRLCDKLENIKKKREKFLVFVKNEDNRQTFQLLKRQVWAFLRHIFPRKVKGEVKFGFEDPYAVGQVLIYASPFYGLYAKDLRLIPVFGEKILEGNLSVKGRIRIGTLLALAIRVFMDKNFRILLKKWQDR